MRLYLNDYERRVKTEANHFSSFASLTQKDDGKVNRFSPKIEAFDEAMRLYQPIFKEKMPHMALDDYIIDYAMNNDKQTKIVSIGCGTGDWEVGLAEKLPERITVDLIEINEELLKYVKEYSSKKKLNINSIIQDANKLHLPADYYDFIVVRSSLHHFIELEHIFSEIKKSLITGGKFLIIGEVIGRKGLLLYDETREVVDKIMAFLPEKYRFNHTTKKIDKKFPNIDYSKDSFEALRSEEIYNLVMRYFNPIEHISFDSIITYLLDFRYGPNYNINDPLDRALIELIVQLDIHYVENKILKPTALFGIFVK